jgi:hypothetical protein
MEVTDAHTFLSFIQVDLIKGDEERVSVSRIMRKINLT